jgi:hypothetical protein
VAALSKLPIAADSFEPLRLTLFFNISSTDSRATDLVLLFSSLCLSNRGLGSRRRYAVSHSLLHCRKTSRPASSTPHCNPRSRTATLGRICPPSPMYLRVIQVSSSIGRYMVLLLLGETAFYQNHYCKSLGASDQGTLLKITH